MTGLTCRECKLKVEAPPRRLRVPGHELVWRTVRPGIEEPHLLLHTAGPA